MEEKKTFDSDIQNLGSTLSIQRMKSFVNDSTRETERTGITFRFHRSISQETQFKKWFKRNFFPLIRIVFLVVILKIVIDTDVENDGSVLEKEWIMETLIALIVIMTITYVLKCIFVYGFNGSQFGYLGFLLSSFAWFQSEIWDHIKDGIYLWERLEGDQEYDSEFIHYSRILILGCVIIFSLSMCFSFCCIGFLYISNVGFGDDTSKEKFAQSIKKIPYSSLFFKEGRDCCLCLGAFQKEEQVAVLKCNSQHIFHSECLREWVRKGRKYCPLCKKDIII